MKYITNFFGVGCVALLAMLIMAPGAFAQTFSPPDAPTDLEAVATDATAGTITLTWSPVADANNGGLPLLTGVAGYKLEASEDPAAATPVWTVVDITGATVGDLTTDPITKFSFDHDLTTEDPSYGITRHYRISAINGEGEGVPSDYAVSTATHNVPDPPTDLAAVVTPDVAGSINVDWSPVDEANNGGLAITSYVLESTADLTADPVDWTPQTATAPDPPTTKYSFTHTGLDAGTTYHYRVRAVNDASTEGGDNATASATTHGVPGLPTGLTAAVSENATTATSSDIALSWTAPASTGGLDITNYVVETSVDNGLTFTDLQAAGSGVTDVTYTQEEQTEQDPVVTHIYRIRAENTAGVGEPSDLLGVKLASRGAPTDFNVMAMNGEEAIELSWAAPVDDGEPELTGYRIEKSVDYDDADPTAATWAELATDYASTVFIDRDLTEDAGTEYNYRVRALNGVSVAGASGTDVGGVPSDVEGAVSSNWADMPANLSAVVAGDLSSIDLAWDGPQENGGSDITHYKIEVSTDAGATWADVDEDKLEHPVEDLRTLGALRFYGYTHDAVDPGTEYHYQVRAINDAGPGTPAVVGPASSGTVPTAPPADLAAGATDGEAGSITLSWDPVAEADNGGWPITAYSVEVTDQDPGDAAFDPASWATSTDITVTAPTAPETRWSAVHTGLDAGTMRYYRVSATNAAGTGDPSEAMSAATHDVPNAPALTAGPTDGEAGSITVSWDPVADGDDGGLPVAVDVASYSVEVTDQDPGDAAFDPASWATSTDITVTAPDAGATPATTQFSAVHTGLDAGTMRYYRVSATNAAGTGDPSEAMSAATHDVPNAPALTAGPTDGEAGSITVSWDPVADGDDGGLPVAVDVASYSVEVTDQDPGDAAFDPASWATSTDITVTAPDAGATPATTQFSAVHTGLDAGTMRYYRVSATNAAGTGDPSEAMSAATHDVPNAPALTAGPTDGEAGSITVSWDPVADGDDGGLPVAVDVASYSVEVTDQDPGDAAFDPASWATSTDITVTAPDAGATPATTQFSAVHTGLDAGTMRYYRVSATNAAGTGDPSEAMSAATHDVPNAPALTAGPTDGEAGSITVSWDPVADGDDGGLPVAVDVASYSVEVTDQDPGDAAFDPASWATSTDITVTAPDAGATPATTQFSAVHTGLDAGTMRYYRVSATNAAGTGDPSEAMSAATHDVPNAPALTAGPTDGEAGSITVSWDPVADGDDGGLPVAVDVASYSVEVTDQDPGDAAFDPASWATSTDITVTAPDAGATPATTQFSAVHTGLDAGTMRYYRVSATNAAGTGDPSEAMSAATHNVPNAPTDLAASATDGGSVTLSWSPVADGDDGGLPVAVDAASYSVEVADDPTDETSWAPSTHITVTAPDLTADPTAKFTAVHDVTSEDPGSGITRYYYRVSATNAAGTGDPSGAVSATTYNVPDPPTDLAAEATEGTAGSITLSWRSSG